MQMNSSLINTYNRLPVAFSRGEGVWLFDTNGKRYLDALSGIAVCGLGHSHQELAAAISEQASCLIHTSNLYAVPLQEQLGKRLLELSQMQGVFLCNSGAEANEAMLKLARLHGHRKGISNAQVIVMEGAFHGRTLATLSATGNAKVHKGFEPLVPGFLRVPFGNIEAVEALANSDNQISALMVEPVLGEGGVIIPDPGYISALRKICDEQDWLLMLDEIQSGMGRTGTWFCHQAEGIIPDVMSLAKALGNGLPIGACLVAGRAEALFSPGSHGTTFGGNPLACRAALTVIECMLRDDLPAQAATRGAQLLTSLRQGLAGLNCVSEVRGHGLMLAIEMDRPCGELVAAALERGLLINVTADCVVRLLPPLIMSESESETLSSGLCQLIKDWNAGQLD